MIDLPKTNDFDPARPVASYWLIAKRAVGDPRGFFRTMATTGGYTAPALFALISFAIPGLITGVIQDNLALPFINLALMGGWVVLVYVVHLVIVRAFQGQANFEATFRVNAYASFIQLLQAIPSLILALIAFFYGLYLVVIGLSEVHRIPIRQAVKAILLVMLGQIVAAMILLRLLPLDLTGM